MSPTAERVWMTFKKEPPAPVVAERSQTEARDALREMLER